MMRGLRAGKNMSELGEEITDVVLSGVEVFIFKGYF